MRGGARDFGQRGKVVKVQICTMIYIYNNDNNWKESNMTINFSMILVILMVKNIKEFNNFCFQMSKTI